MKKYLALFLTLLFIISLCLGCSKQVQQTAKPEAAKTTAVGTTAQKGITENGSYTSKKDVALYIHTYHKLPKNFITKKEAQQLGWKSKGTLDKVAPGKSIGGDHFGNFEKLLPTGSGIKYTECDIDYVKGNRGGKRIVFSNKWAVYYSANHYKNFERLY